MGQISEAEQIGQVSREWGYGIAGYRMKRLSEVMETIARGYRAGCNLEGETGRWELLLRESRRMLSMQYQELADMLSELSEGFADGLAGSRESRDRIKERLAKEGIRLRQIIFVPVQEMRREIHLVARVQKGPNRLADEVGHILSEMLAEVYVPGENCQRIIGQEYGYFVFHQKEPYRLITGAVRAAKHTGEPSGDNYVIVKPCFGEAALAISDGMGTGENACYGSAFVIELLELMLQSGFRKNTMISLLNSVLLLLQEERAYATVDMCLLDLFRGVATFVKSGAATAYIKRDDFVEVVEDSGLPVGMLPEIRPVVTEKKLYHGESIIIMSDGVMDCFPEEGENGLRQVIREMKAGTPQDMAGALLLLALKQNNYEPKDDMTVLVARLEVE